jgi:hypothetical protein
VCVCVCVCAFIKVGETYDDAVVSDLNKLADGRGTDEAVLANRHVFVDGQRKKCNLPLPRVQASKRVGECDCCKSVRTSAAACSEPRRQPNQYQTKERVCAWLSVCARRSVHLHGASRVLCGGALKVGLESASLCEGGSVSGRPRE